MASMLPSWRCAKPHSTNHSTDRYTDSQLVWKARAVSKQQPARPARQESHHGAGQRALAVAPGNVLDDHAVLGTMDPPGRVTEVGGDAPKGHKQPAPLVQAVVGGRGLLAARTAAADTGMGFYADLDGIGLLLLAKQAHLAENETDEVLHEIQNSLNLQLNG